MLLYFLQNSYHAIIVTCLMWTALLWIFRSVQSLSHVWVFATPWTTACQAFRSISKSQSLLKLRSIASAMPFDHLILFSSPPAYVSYWNLLIINFPSFFISLIFIFRVPLVWSAEQTRRSWRFPSENVLWSMKAFAIYLFHFFFPFILVIFPSLLMAKRPPSHGRVWFPNTR